MTEERKSQILDIIGKVGYIKVEDLAKKIYTSSSTVRRNLNSLEKAGLVKRSYGGVELCQSAYDPPLSLRFRKNHLEKSIIAQKASKYLKDNSVIFIDSSSTCLHMVPFLQEYKNITVYTDGLELCSALSELNITVVCTGGEFFPRSRAFAGEHAISLVEKLYFDAFFFSTSGFCDGVITDIFAPTSHLRRKLLENSKEKYFLYDKSKIGVKDSFIICKESDLTAIITE